MKVCIVGGVFGRSQSYQETVTLTPETVLAQGLDAKGIEVEKRGHVHPIVFDGCDVVHVHHLGAGALTMAATRRRPPFIFTPHDPSVFCGYEKSWVVRMAQRYVRHYCDALVALSDRERQYLSRVTGGRKPIYLIPNGVPGTVFYPDLQRRESLGKPWRLLYVGQLAEFKGVDVLLKALPCILQSCEAELSLAYHNPRLEKQYQALAAELGVMHRVRFIGALATDELAALYRSADVFVLPSHAECLPSVITEALLSGLPIVATNVGGIPEQIGPYGRLVPPDDPIALSQAVIATVQHLASGVDDRRERSAYARDRFSVENMIDSHVDVYQRVMETYSRRPNKTVPLFGPFVHFLLHLRSSRKRLATRPIAN